MSSHQRSKRYTPGASLGIAVVERALKERIVGAIVLVTVIVLVVPVFLDGPPTDEVISERVPLPGQEEQTMQTVVLDRDRTEPVPAPIAATPNDSTDDEPVNDEQVANESGGGEAFAPGLVEVPIASDESTVAEALPEDPPPPVTEPMPEAVAVVEDEQIRDEAPVEVASMTSSTGMWAVQIGSFSSQENAENLAADLRRQGFAAFLSQHSGASGQLHRVRVGPQRDREEAEAMAARLSAAGHRGQVVPHP